MTVIVIQKLMVTLKISAMRYANPMQAKRLVMIPLRSLVPGALVVKTVEHRPVVRWQPVTDLNHDYHMTDLLLTIATLKNQFEHPSRMLVKERTE
jgi:hypothetical protein